MNLQLAGALVAKQSSVAMADTNHEDEILQVCTPKVPNLHLHSFPPYNISSAKLEVKVALSCVIVITNITQSYIPRKKKNTEQEIFFISDVSMARQQARLPRIPIQPTQMFIIDRM
jgi:hypothetical protein